MSALTPIQLTELVCAILSGRGDETRLTDTQGVKHTQLSWATDLLPWVDWSILLDDEHINELVTYGSMGDLPTRLKGLCYLRWVLSTDHRPGQTSIDLSKDILKACDDKSDKFVFCENVTSFLMSHAVSLIGDEATQEEILNELAIWGETFYWVDFSRQDIGEIIALAIEVMSKQLKKKVAHVI